MKRLLAAALLFAALGLAPPPAHAQQARVVTACGSMAPFATGTPGTSAFPTIDTTGKLCLSGGGGGGSIVGGTTPVTGTCPAGQFLYNNSGVVGCSASSATIALPQAVTGGVSGGIPYFSATTTMSASALLTNNAFMLGGGAGAAPKTTTTNAGAVTAVGIAPNAIGGMALVSTVPTAGNFVKWAAGGLVDGGAGGGSTTPGGSSGQIQYNNSSAFGGFTASGDATINTTTGAVAVTKTGGVAFGALATVTPGTGVATAAAANINASGGLAAAAAPLTTGGSASVTGAFGYYICTGVCTVTLPTPAAGFQFCVRNDDNIATVITIAAISGVQFEKTTFNGYGTVTTGTMVSGGAAGDKVCLVGRDATHYLVGGFNGTWTNS